MGTVLDRVHIFAEPDDTSAAGRADGAILNNTANDTAATISGEVCRLGDIPTAAWDDLAARSCEPSGYQLADWSQAVDAHAKGRGDAMALTAWLDDELIGVVPVVPCSRLYGLPLPALVSADNYSALATPLLDEARAGTAAGQLLQQARDAGTHALVLRDIPLDGPAAAAFTRALALDGLKPRIVQSYARAALDAQGDAEALLQQALGSKKLKELRRLRKRLAQTGEVRFTRARAPADVADTLEIFLEIEASGWKGQRGTALLCNEGDTAFIRRATAALAKHGQCEIVTLHAGETAVAAAIVIRHRNHAYYYKIGVDERFAKYSPGVQLTLDLTQAMCADRAIAFVDSTAGAGNAMIEPIWQQRVTIGDLFIPLRRHDPLAALVYAGLIARLRIREPLRQLVRRLRNWKRKQARAS